MNDPLYSPYRNLGNPSQPNPYMWQNPQNIDWSKAPGVKSVAPTGAQPSWLEKNIIDNPWLEAGLGFIPGIGNVASGLWGGVRGAYHLAHGNTGKAVSAVGWGLAGAIPGAAYARLAKRGIDAAKLGGQAAKLGTGLLARGVTKAAPLIGTTSLGTVADGVGNILPNRSAGNAVRSAAAPINSFEAYGDNLLSQAIVNNRQLQQ